jgi:hypothetical protein
MSKGTLTSYIYLLHDLVQEPWIYRSVYLVISKFVARPTDYIT